MALSVADLEHRASRAVDQDPSVVHDRLLELAERLRRETPPIEPGTQAATFLGISGPLGIEIADRGPGRIELRTTRGRVRGEGAATIEPAGEGRTTLSMEVAIRPQGFTANLVLGAAMATMPGMESRIRDGLEHGLDDLVVELAKPDEEWDPEGWQPQGIRTS
jgi:hypothetical protein